MIDPEARSKVRDLLIEFAVMDEDRTYDTMNDTDKAAADEMTDIIVDIYEVLHGDQVHSEN